jgi:hypothetical protein
MHGPDDFVLEGELEAVGEAGFGGGVVGVRGFAVFAGWVRLEGVSVADARER